MEWHDFNKEFNIFILHTSCTLETVGSGFNIKIPSTSSTTPAGITFHLLLSYDLTTSPILTDILIWISFGIAILLLILSIVLLMVMGYFCYTKKPIIAKIADEEVPPLEAANSIESNKRYHTMATLHPRRKRSMYRPMSPLK